MDQGCTIPTIKTHNANNKNFETGVDSCIWFCDKYSDKVQYLDRKYTDVF